MRSIAAKNHVNVDTRLATISVRKQLAVRIVVIAQSRSMVCDFLVDILKIKSHATGLVAWPAYIAI